MHPRHTAEPGRHWDGTPTTRRPLRSLRVAADSPSRLLRTAQPAPCRACGNRTDWYTSPHGRPIGLHPQELPSAAVPAACRWHVASGVAYPSHDGSAWCRIPHTPLCPADNAPKPLTPRLNELRRRLALRTRRLLDTGAFTPVAESEPTSQAAVCRPARPVVQILYGCYLATCPIDAIQCVAQTRRRHRCTNSVLDPDDPSGIWRLMATTARHGQLALTARDMAVYDLTHLPYDTQIRWRTQRCTTHAAAPAAADLTLTAWEPFDPLLHHAHIHHRLPDTARRTGRTNSRTCPARPARGQA
ncbi:DUF6083 domain-containing protein [Streptomyces sp. V4I23]|uniref:DUF6083 domain-containing protein n=1 Tax=Streptomyces sp. V4I23 TaxID=3042282 RepID=UPI0027D82900|nr:DUF6083 domain-containing protein [Streptomyces sp. V4I23]